jgi:nitroreductase
MEIMEHIRTRRTVRSFTTDPIPGDVLDAILEAGMWAPSHANIQPWEFVLIGLETRARLLAVFQAKAEELLADPDTPAKKRDNIMRLKDDFGGAPLMVAVVSRAPEDDLQAIENPLSCAAAVQNMSLAASDAGVGTVWLSLGVAPPARSILGIEEGQSVVALLAMGYPADTPAAPPRDSYTDHVRRLP